MQVLILGRAPRTKETLPDFLKWRRVTRPPLVFRGLTGSQRTPGFWGVTDFLRQVRAVPIPFLRSMAILEEKTPCMVLTITESKAKTPMLSAMQLEKGLKKMM